MLNFFRDLNDHYAQAIQAVTSIVLCIVGILGLFHAWDFFSGGFIRNPVFSLGDLKVVEVRKYKELDGPPGYEITDYFFRPAQWRNKVITIIPIFMFFRKVTPIDKSDILEVIISIKGKNCSIFFNKD